MYGDKKRVYLPRLCECKERFALMYNIDQISTHSGNTPPLRLSRHQLKATHTVIKRTKTAEPFADTKQGHSHVNATKAYSTSLENDEGALSQVRSDVLINVRPSANSGACAPFKPYSDPPPPPIHERKPIAPPKRGLKERNMQGRNKIVPSNRQNTRRALENQGKQWTRRRRNKHTYITQAIKPRFNQDLHKKGSKP